MIVIKINESSKGESSEKREKKTLRTQNGTEKSLRGILL